jgi:membrane protease YdiL (CAAX protease family)
MKKEVQMHATKVGNISVSWLLMYIAFVCISSGLDDFFVSPHIMPYIASNPLLVLVEPVWKLFFWLLPTFLYIRYVENEDPLTYLKLNTRVGWGILWGLVVALVVVVVILSNKYLLLHQHFHTHGLTLDELLNQVLLVGLMEEVPFRGVVFQKLQDLVGFWWGAILAGLVFVELHIAYWVSLGRSPVYLLDGALTIFIFTLVSCALLKCTRSLWSSIIFHMVYDFTSIFFV